MLQKSVKEKVCYEPDFPRYRAHERLQTSQQKQRSINESIQCLFYSYCSEEHYIVINTCRQWMGKKWKTKCRVEWYFVTKLTEQLWVTISNRFDSVVSHCVCVCLCFLSTHALLFGFRIFFLNFYLYTIVQLCLFYTLQLRLAVIVNASIRV